MSKGIPILTKVYPCLGEKSLILDVFSLIIFMLFCDAKQVIVNFRENGQAMQGGTHLAKMKSPPAGGPFISLVGETSPNPFEQLRTGAGCAFLRNA